MCVNASWEKLTAAIPPLGSDQKNGAQSLIAEAAADWLHALAVLSRAPDLVSDLHFPSDISSM